MKKLLFRFYIALFMLGSTYTQAGLWNSICHYSKGVSVFNQCADLVGFSYNQEVERHKDPMIVQQAEKAANDADGLTDKVQALQNQLQDFENNGKKATPGYVKCLDAIKDAEAKINTAQEAKEKLYVDADNKFQQDKPIRHTVLEKINTASNIYSLSSFSCFLYHLGRYQSFPMHTATGIVGKTEGALGVIGMVNMLFSTDLGIEKAFYYYMLLRQGEKNQLGLLLSLDLSKLGCSYLPKSIKEKPKQYMPKFIAKKYSQVKNIVQKNRVVRSSLLMMYLAWYFKNNNQTTSELKDTFRTGDTFWFDHKVLHNC